MSESADVLSWVDENRDRFLEELRDYLRIPSISTDPAYAEEVDRCSRFLTEKMGAAGLTAERIETDGHPLVYAEWGDAKGKPTVLFYGHYDVQPPDPVEEWSSPPFEPTVSDGRLVARGATDDKGQSYTHLKAVESMLRVRGELPVNVKFLVEGEEESGGQSIEAYVRRDGGERLGCDCVVISDTSMFARGQPSLLYGLKGLAYVELRVRGPNRDLHSGTFGGAVQNPLNALATILAALRDSRSGRVLIPGFYDAVRPLEDWERREFAALPFDEETYRRDLGVDVLAGEEGYTTLERVWARPTLDLNGIWGGYQGAGAKTVLPGKAGAKLSMRLVPDQEPQHVVAALRAFVETLAPPGVTVELQEMHGARPVLVEPSGPFMEAAYEALEAEWGRRPVKVREGGSIPIVGTFAEVLDAPVLLMGFGLTDDRLHAPNEKLDLENFYGGIRSIVRLLDGLGEIAPGAGG